MSPAMGEAAISVVLGIGFIVAGVVFLIVSLAAQKSLLTVTAIIGYVILAFGILCMTAKVMDLIFSYIPYLTVAIGSGITLDAVLGLTVRKEKNYFAFAIKLIFGVALLVFGILILTVSAFKEFVSVVLGIALILVAIYCIVKIISDNKKKKAD